MIEKSGKKRRKRKKERQTGRAWGNVANSDLHRRDELFIGLGATALTCGRCLGLSVTRLNYLKPYIFFPLGREHAVDRTIKLIFMLHEITCISLKSQSDSF